jgi:hypothetical protein
MKARMRDGRTDTTGPNSDRDRPSDREAADRHYRLHRWITWRRPGKQQDPWG